MAEKFAAGWSGMGEFNASFGRYYNWSFTLESISGLGRSPKGYGGRQRAMAVAKWLKRVQNFAWHSEIQNPDFGANVWSEN